MIGRTLKDYMNEQKELSHPNGTFVQAILDDKTKSRLETWLTGKNIPNLVDKSSFHTTILFSKKGVPKASNYKIPLPIKAKATSWEIFDTTMEGTGKCLVLKIESKDLTNHHNHYIKAYGATHTFDSYKPHVTVSYSFSGQVPKNLPDFDLVFDKTSFEPLDNDWSAKVKKKK